MKQKRIILAVTLLFFTSLLYTSCKKDKEKEETDSEELTASDEALDDELTYTIGGLAYSEDENFYSRRAKCGNISFSGNTYPLTVTIDFGAGCQGPMGNTRKGKIIIEFTDSLKATGSERKITFDNYSINNNKITGYRKFKNMGKNNAGNPEFTTESDIMLETAGGKMLRRKHTGTREWIKGFGTFNKSDDEFLVTGNGSLVRPDGTTITRTIKTPVHIALNCRYPIAGMVEFTSPSNKAAVDFGDGTCDEKAVITTNAGLTIEVDLSQWKRRKAL